MADYIDRERLIKAIPKPKQDQSISLIGAVADMFCIINAAPKEDVAPVVHAEWIWDDNGMDWGLGAWLCDACFCRNANLPANKKINPYVWAGAKYCPHCGAKMDSRTGKKED